MVLGQTADGTRRLAQEGLSKLGCLERAEAMAGLADLSPAQLYSCWTEDQEERNSCSNPGPWDRESRETPAPDKNLEVSPNISKMSCSLGLEHLKQEKSQIFLCDADGLASPGCSSCYGNPQVPPPSLHFPHFLGMADQACFTWWASSTGLCCD